MSQNLSAFTPTKFSLKLIAKLWNETLYNKVCNTDYEGDIKNEGDRVVVRTEQDINLNTYTKGMTLVAQDLNPIKEELVVDQMKYFKFVVDDVDKLQNDIKTIDVHSNNARKQMAKTVDTDIFSYAWKQVYGDNFLGTDYSTGTVTVTVTTGAVTGSGTTFTTGMVGCPFKANGHTAYYRIASYSSATAIVIEDYGSSGVYTGGAIGAGATYVIKGATPVQLSKSNIYQYVCSLGEVLDTSNTPDEGRWLVINAKAKAVLRQAPEFIPAVDKAYNDVVVSAKIGEIGGFEVFRSELIAGANGSTTGYYFLAGDKGFISFAMQVMKTSVISSDVDPNSFVNTCKGLLVWGRKVFEGTRARGAVLRAYF